MFVQAFSCIRTNRLILLLVLYTSFGWAQEPPSIPPASPSETADITSCGFPGNADIYGVGIRIGYYTQALSVWFANYFVLSESKALHSVNLLFTFAVFIGLAWLSHDPSECHAIEAYFLNHLLVATWRIGVVDRSRFSRKHWSFRPVSFVTQDLVLLAMMSYSTWYFWIGLDLMEETPCGTFVFALVKVDLYGWFRIVAKMVCATAMATAPLLILFHGAALYRHWYTKPIRQESFYRRLAQSLEAEHAGKPTSTIEVLEIAARTPLPESPLLSDGYIEEKIAAAEVKTHSLLWRQANGAAIPKFAQLADAEAYLENILSLPTSNLNPHTLHIPHTSITISIPSLVQVRRMRDRIPNRNIFTAPFRSGIVSTTARYIYEQRSFPLYCYPKMYEMALESPHHSTMTFETLHTLMALRTIRLPDYVPPAAYMPTAIARFSMLVVLVVSLELSVQWNHISGMSSFGAVGQLVPAVLGVGGLVKVFWTWWDRGSIDETSGHAIERDVEEASYVYERLKQKNALRHSDDDLQV